MPFSCSSQGDGRVLVQDEDPADIGYHVPSDVILSEEDRGRLKTIRGQSAASADIQVKRGPSLSTDAPNPNHPSPPLTTSPPIALSTLSSSPFHPFLPSDRSHLANIILFYTLSYLAHHLPLTLSSDSPVSADSLQVTSLPSTSRPSDGTRSPALSRTMSPTTYRGQEGHHKRTRCRG